MSLLRNPDGTYNGVVAMAMMTGLSEAEVEWTFTRLQRLMGREKKTKAEALAIVRAESQSKPWLQKDLPAAKS